MTTIAIGRVATGGRSIGTRSTVTRSVGLDSARGVTPTRLRLTVRGRRVLAALAAVPAVFALTAAVLSGGAAIASRDAGMPADSFQTVTVLSGDSLWSIAQEVAPQADPRDVVDAIMRLNALDGATVAAGQRLAIPAQYSDAG